jgi:hypothetical protein
MLLDQYDAKANSIPLVWLPLGGGEPLVIADSLGVDRHWGPQ